MANINDWTIAIEYASAPQTTFIHHADDDSICPSGLSIPSFVERGAALSSVKLRDSTSDPEQNYVVCRFWYLLLRSLI